MQLPQASLVDCVPPRTTSLPQGGEGKGIRAKRLQKVNVGVEVSDLFYMQSCTIFKC